MPTECFSAVCVLAIVIIGLLIMVRAVSLEQVFAGAVRLLTLVVVAILSWCLLRSVFFAFFLPAFSWLKSAMLWTLVVVAALLTLALVTNFAARRVITRSRESSDSGRPM